MIAINVEFTEDEFDKLLSKKLRTTWHDFIMTLVEKEKPPTIAVETEPKRDLNNPPMNTESDKPIPYDEFEKDAVDPNTAHRDPRKE